MKANTINVSDDISPSPKTSIPLYPFKNMVYLEQFVEHILDYTSKFNSCMSISYAPENLIGKPTKYPEYGDFPETYMLRSYGKWWNESEAAQIHYMSNDVDSLISEDYVCLRFEYPVFPDVVFIYETYNPGAIVRLWGRLSGRKWKLLWEGPPEKYRQTSRKFNPPIKKLSETINELRIEFNQSLLKYHTALDAILLVGYKPKTILQSTIVNSSLLQPSQSYTKNTSSHCAKIGNAADYFSTLPYEVITHIFHHLDLRSLCRCSQVNQRFFEASMDASLYMNLSLKRYWHKIDDDTLLHLMARCKILKKLDLSWCGNDGMISENIFLQFLQKWCTVLTNLSLGNCDFVRASSLETIGKCRELTDLRLRNNKCNSKQFSVLCHLKKLEALDLFNSNISDDELISILKSNPSLKYLIIDFCANLEHLDEVTRTVSLCNKNLVVWSSWKTQSLSAVGVSYLSNCSSLKELDLGWCLLLRVPEDCLERIAYGCAGLKRLIISGWWGISDHLLVPVIQNCKLLTQLDLLGVKTITNDIVDRILACLPKLELLEISFCDSISSEQIASWRNQYPKVVIQRSCEYITDD